MDNLLLRIPDLYDSEVEDLLIQRDGAGPSKEGARRVTRTSQQQPVNILGSYDEARMRPAMGVAEAAISHAAHNLSTEPRWGAEVGKATSLFPAELKGGGTPSSAAVRIEARLEPCHSEPSVGKVGMGPDVDALLAGSGGAPDHTSVAEAAAPHLEIQCQCVSMSQPPHSTACNASQSQKSLMTIPHPIPPILESFHRPDPNVHLWRQQPAAILMACPKQSQRQLRSGRCNIKLPSRWDWISEATRQLEIMVTDTHQALKQIEIMLAISQDALWMRCASQKQRQIWKSDINQGSLHALLTAKHLVSLQKNSRSLSNMLAGDCGQLSTFSAGRNSAWFDRGSLSGYDGGDVGEELRSELDCQEAALVIPQSGILDPPSWIRGGENSVRGLTGMLMGLSLKQQQESEAQN